MFFRAFFVWIFLALLAILNGIFREAILTPRFNALAAHLVSTLLLGALIFLVAALSRSYLKTSSSAEAWSVGLLWLVLTLAFEFLAGHFAFGNPWSKILADYDLSTGRIWILVPISTLIAPRIAWRPADQDHNRA